MSDAEFVGQLYRELLGREPDPMEALRWISEFGWRTASRYSMFLRLVSTDEFRLRFARAAGARP